MTYELVSHKNGASLSGELTIYTAGEIKGSCAKLLSKRKKLEIDLSAVTEIDTAGLQLMLLLKRKPGVEVSFANHSAPVLRLLDLTNLAGALGDPVLIDTKNERE